MQLYDHDVEIKSTFVNLNLTSESSERDNPKASTLDNHQEYKQV